MYRLERKTWSALCSGLLNGIMHINYTDTRRRRNFPFPTLPKGCQTLLKNTYNQQDPVINPLLNGENIKLKVTFFSVSIKQHQQRGECKQQSACKSANNVYYMNEIEIEINA